MPNRSWPQPHTRPRQLCVLPHWAPRLLCGPAETRAHENTQSGPYRFVAAAPGHNPEKWTRKLKKKSANSVCMVCVILLALPAAPQKCFFCSYWRLGCPKGLAWTCKVQSARKAWNASRSVAGPPLDRTKTAWSPGGRRSSPPWCPDDEKDHKVQIKMLHFNTHLSCWVKTAFQH